MNIDFVRNFFPICQKYTYFQSAGLSPLPYNIYYKFIENYTDLLNKADIEWEKDFEKLKQTFSIIAKFINAEPEDVIFVENNSLAMSLVGLSLKNAFKDFNIISLEEEFPSNSVPFEYLGIQMKYVPHNNHRYTINDILNFCDEKTKAVVVSYVQYSTGYRLDIETLGKELRKRNILFIVNATQAFPFFNIDIKSMNIDVLTCSIHKWGFCGHIGTIFVTSKNYRLQYPSPIAGWLSVDTSFEEDFIHYQKNSKFNLWKTAQQYNFGSSNIKNRILIKDALIFIENIGLNEIRKHVFRLSDYLISYLKNVGVKITSPIENIEERSFILSFDIGKENNRQLLNFLYEKNIIVALRNNNVRVSLNLFNNKDDIDKLCSTIDDFLKKKL
jgi:selenocysteine lyase/cysteine desulfurase